MTPPAVEVTTADLSSVSLTTSLYQAAIGPVGAQHYVPLFVRFEEQDRVGPSWNWAAAVCTLYWMAYRHLWRTALAYFATIASVGLLLVGIIHFWLRESKEVQLGLLLGFVVAAFVVPGVWADGLLYNACRKRITQALMHSATVDQACAKLSADAPSRKRAAFMVLVQVGVLGLATLGYFGYIQQEIAGYEPRKNAEQKQGVEENNSHAHDAVSTPTDSSRVVANIDEKVESLGATSDARAAASTSDITVDTEEKDNATHQHQGTTTPNVSAVSQAPSPSEIDDSTSTLISTEKKTAASTAMSTTTEQQIPTPGTPPDVSVLPSLSISTSITTLPPQKKREPESPLFYVGVGLFAERQNALRAYNKLRQSKLPALQQEVQSSKGKRTQVQVGPFHTEAQAKEAIVKVRLLDLDAILLRPNKVKAQ